MSVASRLACAHHISQLLREYIRAEEKVHKTSEARRALPPGSSRARVTTANARWMTAREHRDLVEARLRDDFGVDLGGTR